MLWNGSPVEGTGTINTIYTFLLSIRRIQLTSYIPTTYILYVTIAVRRYVVYQTLV